MNAQEFRTQILLKKPRYAKSVIPVFEAFANKGKSKSEYSQFGPLYELFIYAFTLGLKKGLKLPLPPRNSSQDFVEIAKWKGGGSLVDFLLMIIFAHAEEIGFDWNELEDLDEKELGQKITDAIDFMDSYANGGLQYLKGEFEANNLLNSPYLFVDLMADISNDSILEEKKSEMLIQASSSEIESKTTKDIDAGESSKCEFKSTLRVNLHTNSPDEKIELSAMKTLAGFLNTKDGVLLIGVSDDKTILGLDTDFNSFRNKEDKLDEFQKHLDNLIENYFGNSVFSLLKVSFVDIIGKLICRIEVRHSTQGPVYLKNKAKKAEEFYIRRSASTKSLNPSEMMYYIQNNWENS